MEKDGDPRLILDKIASAMTSLGMNNAPISQGEFFVILGPEHAYSLASTGFSRDDVSLYLYDRARTRHRCSVATSRSWPGPSG